jgi:hypothetical protein
MQVTCFPDDSIKKLGGDYPGEISLGNRLENRSTYSLEGALRIFVGASLERGSDFADFTEHQLVVLLLTISVAGSVTECRFAWARDF